MLKKPSHGEFWVTGRSQLSIQLNHNLVVLPNFTKKTQKKVLEHESAKVISVSLKEFSPGNLGAMYHSQGTTAASSAKTSGDFCGQRFRFPPGLTK